ncbi:MAG: RNA polymerase sigma factor [Gammaproteobacteria bacterium]|nr:RNA polymerase sigma factor [Gammaproteobacteria bacterium]MBU1415790.1 RNA polymerase sigma factor [Gammaproteobacteria bacterium]
MDLLKFIGRTRQFERQLEESRPRLWRLAHTWCRNGALADDLVQEALSKGLKHHGQLREEASLHAWLCGILAHCWHDYLRSHRHMDNVADIDESLLVADGTPEAECLQSQIVKRVRRAVADLPVPQREVVTLVDLEEFSYAEVAAILEIPIGTVMSRLSRARATLKERLREHNACSLATPRIARVK